MRDSLEHLHDAQDQLNACISIIEEPPADPAAVWPI